VMVARDRLHQAATLGALSDPLGTREGRTPFNPPSTGLQLHYLQNPFRREPDFAATSVTYDLRQLLPG